MFFLLKKTEKRKKKPSRSLGQMGLAQSPSLAGQGGSEPPPIHLSFLRRLSFLNCKLKLYFKGTLRI
jgi:hypothetical protein